jgi:hypothetical protein
MQPKICENEEEKHGIRIFFIALMAGSIYVLQCGIGKFDNFFSVSTLFWWTSIFAALDTCIY